MKRVSAWLWLCVFMAWTVQPAQAASSTIVISQVYGGGGNAGATLRNDFIELFNKGTATVSVDGWTIQYASSAGSSWNAIALSGSIEPGRYYLIAAAQGAGGTQDLPSAQAAGSVNLSATTGKIALVSNSTLLSESCLSAAAIVDFIGYGSANCSEASPAATLTNTTSLVRAGNGCIDTDNNSSDFYIASPTPRTAASAPAICGSETAPTPIPPLTPPAATVLEAPPLIFPHFAQGSGYQTTFTFHNVTETATTVNLALYSQSGASIGSTAVALPANGSARYLMTGSALTVGWARAALTIPTEIAGTETIQLFNSGTLVMEASAFAAQPDTTLRLPVYEKEGFRTGVAILNLGPSSSTVSMNIKTESGSSITTSSVNLTPSQQTARFVSELFPNLTNFEGMLELSSSSLFAALALRQNLATGTFSMVPVLPQSTEVYFSPGGSVASRIVQEIQRAQATIDVAIYSFTRDEIADALIAAKNRGVAVRIIADSSQADGSGSDIARLEAAGIPLKRYAGGGGGIMHNKVAIFDSRIVLTGSYNWSTAAEASNDENAIFIRTPAVVTAYQAKFNALWARR